MIEGILIGVVSSLIVAALLYNKGEFLKVIGWVLLQFLFVVWILLLVLCGFIVIFMVISFFDLNNSTINQATVIIYIVTLISVMVYLKLNELKLGIQFKEKEDIVDLAKVSSVLGTIVSLAACLVSYAFLALST